jgi:Flp pilus assembly pilin Flp
VRRLRAFPRATGGATAAEFALVVPLLLLLMFAVIDVGRLMWTWNQAEKATAAAARYAVATNVLTTGLDTYDFARDGGLSQGAVIPQSLFGGVTCTSTGCTCRSNATCPPLGTFSSTDFGLVADRVRWFLPNVTNANVRVDYDYSGLGFAGDPNAPDVAPTVTVTVRNLTFTPLSTLVFRVNIPLPPFQSSLTLEDGVGRRSN